MKPRELADLGVPRGEAMKVAGAACAATAAAGLDKAAIRKAVAELVADLKAYVADPHFGALANAIAGVKGAQQLCVPRAEAAPWRQWGTDLEPSAFDQLRNACRLSVAVAGALMPDADQGYGPPRRWGALVTSRPDGRPSGAAVPALAAEVSKLRTRRRPSLGGTAAGLQPTRYMPSLRHVAAPPDAQRTGRSTA